MESSNGYFRRVEILGSDETGYVVSVLEHYTQQPLPGYPPPFEIAPSPTPQPFTVFMPLTEEQILSIFSNRGQT